MAPRGRPRTGELIRGIRLPVELLAQVDAWAAAEGVTRAEAFRQLVGRQLSQDSVLAPHEPLTRVDPAGPLTLPHPGCQLWGSNVCPGWDWCARGGCARGG